jgi:hypothetical protein
MQLIIVYIIIAIAIGYAVYSIVKFIRKKEDPCAGCSGCDIKNEIMRNCKEKAEKTHKTNE